MADSGLTTRIVKTGKLFWKDFTERAVNTFWQGAAPSLAAIQLGTDWSVMKSVAFAAAVGGAGALLSMAKSLIVRDWGIVNSASATKSV